MNESRSLFDAWLMQLL